MFATGPLPQRVAMRVLTVLVIIAIPSLLFGVTHLLSREFSESQAQRVAVERSFSTRARLIELLSLHQDLETGHRGYVIAEDPRFLEPYTYARVSIAKKFSELESGIEARSALRLRFPALRKASAAKIAISARGVEAVRRGQGQAARAFVTTGEGKRWMDQLRAVIASMDRIERDELARRGALADESRVQLQRTAFGLQAVLILLLAVAAWAVFRSLKARRRALIRAEDLGTRQAAIFENAKDGMLTINPSGGIETINPAAAKMYGYAPDELLRRDVGMLFEAAPDRGEIETFLTRLQARRAGDRGRAQEFWSRRKDGTTFLAEVAISPVPLADGMRYVAVMRDVTERKHVEQMKTEFVSTVSHELRTPLTSIAGSLGLLVGGAAGELPERARRLVTIAYDNCQRLVRLINDILDVEKIESGKTAFSLQPVPLLALIEATVQANATFAESHGVSVTIDPVPEGAAVLADADRLVQVVTNLLSNAIKFSPEDEAVTIAVTALDRRYRISVADRGPGISGEFRERIFGKFAQADSSDTRQKGGTGLGLSITREIVTRLGGEVGFTDRAGGGTVFHVDLPAVTSAPHGRDTALALPVRGGSDGNLPLVLHVDDDPDMLRVVATAFEGKAQVHSTPSVEEASAAVRRFRYDAAVLDIGMADGSGLDLLPLFDEQETPTPVVVFTAQDPPWDLGSKVNAVLVKSRASLDRLVQTTLQLADRVRAGGRQ